MGLFLPKIKEEAFINLPKNTKILIKEFREGLTTKFKTYTSSVLLFRPLLIHFANKIYGHKNVPIHSYSHAIELLDKKIGFSKEYRNFLVELKNIANAINHDMLAMVPNKNDDIVNGMWDFIKWMCEKILINY